MDVVINNLSTNRRSFLTGLGLSAFALAGLVPYFRIAPQAWAATKPTRFVYAWTAFDLLDPHVKYDGNAYFFNLNTSGSLIFRVVSNMVISFRHGRETEHDQRTCR